MSRKLCNAPGCNNIVEGGDSRCPQHVLPAYTPKRHYDHHYYQGKAIYKSSRWTRLRAAQLQSEPCCRMCSQFGISTPATIVDHIKEISDGADPWDATNFQSLCRSCHNRKSGDELKKRRAKRRNGGFKSMSDF